MMDLRRNKNEQERSTYHHFSQILADFCLSHCIDFYGSIPVANNIYYILTTSARYYDGKMKIRRHRIKVFSSFQYLSRSEAEANKLESITVLALKLFNIRQSIKDKITKIKLLLRFG